MKPQKRTITLTGRPPIWIKEADWPVVAVGEVVDKDQYNKRRMICTIRVRQRGAHAIVYGTYRFRPADGKKLIAYAGEYLDTADTRAITTELKRVARTLVKQGAPRDVIALALQKCIALLPPEIAR